MKTKKEETGAQHVETCMQTKHERVLEAIRSGNTRLFEIWAAAGLKERECDRVLQQLRKAGKISWASKTGWAINEGGQE